MSHALTVHDLTASGAFEMIRRRVLPLLAAAVLTVPALSGCILISTENPDYDPPAPVPTTAGAPAGKAPATGLPTAMPSLPGSRKPASGKTIEDPCELLNKVEVIALTGRQVTRTDADGADEDTAVRFCQWQLDGGQLAVFVSHTTETEFGLQAKNGTPVTGVGDAVFTQGGHLYVLAGDVQVDVYARGGEDAANLKVARQVATTVLPRL
ncbi:hypothetical protein [Catenuloplanes atrovinosus]|uniref:DUF3558 domain-containing protein n=1 Tax=Catenuloplanes atrovinosus TaxID=137266 RepID=A0AAE4C7D3_9ACTN|nr:hypothetical protein [Catenuloplanes atrovinosus]MDR7273748.1 hypothetical protein [Catenuloplanes atrovinosus]